MEDRNNPQQEKTTELYFSETKEFNASCIELFQELDKKPFFVLALLLRCLLPPGVSSCMPLQTNTIGVDVLSKKDGQAAVAQCKRYGAEKCVGSPEIQQFVGSMQIYGAARGFFVATTRFSPPAVKLAAGRGIELIDDAKLALLVFPRE